jgi:hypothetical protein
MQLSPTQRTVIGALGASIAATVSPVRVLVGSVLVLLALWEPP